MVLKGITQTSGNRFDFQESVSQTQTTLIRGNPYYTYKTTNGITKADGSDFRFSNVSNITTQEVNTNTEEITTTMFYTSLDIITGCNVTTLETSTDEATIINTSTTRKAVSSFEDTYTHFSTGISTISTDYVANKETLLVNTTANLTLKNSRQQNYILTGDHEVKTGGSFFAYEHFTHSISATLNYYTYGSPDGDVYLTYLANAVSHTYIDIYNSYDVSNIHYSFQSLEPYYINTRDFNKTSVSSAPYCEYQFRVLLNGEILSQTRLEKKYTTTLSSYTEEVTIGKEVPIRLGTEKKTIANTFSKYFFAGERFNLGEKYYPIYSTAPVGRIIEYQFDSCFGSYCCNGTYTSHPDNFFVTTAINYDLSDNVDYSQSDYPSGYLQAYTTTYESFVDTDFGNGRVFTNITKTVTSSNYSAAKCSTTSKRYPLFFFQTSRETANYNKPFMSEVKLDTFITTYVSSNGDAYTESTFSTLPDGIINSYTVSVSNYKSSTFSTTFNYLTTVKIVLSSETQTTNPYKNISTYSSISTITMTRRKKSNVN